MSEQEQARVLAQWLDQESLQEGLDPDVVEAVVALRPDLAPPARVSIDDILAEVHAGPVATTPEPEAVAALAAWMEERPGAPPPPGTDSDVVEAVIALRPDLAPAHRVDLVQILDGIKEGPLARSADKESSLVSLGAERTRRKGPGVAMVGFGLLAAAAIAMVAIRVLDTPDRSLDSTATEQLARGESEADDAPRSDDEIRAQNAQDDAQHSKEAESAKMSRNVSAPAPPGEFMEQAEAPGEGRAQGLADQDLGIYDKEKESAPMDGVTASAKASADLDEPGLDYADEGEDEAMEYLGYVEPMEEASAGLASESPSASLDFMDAAPEVARAESSATERPNRRRSGSSAGAGAASYGNTAQTAEFVIEKLSLPAGSSAEIEADLMVRLSAYNSQLQSCASGAGLLQSNISGRVLLNLDFTVQTHSAQSIQVWLSGSALEDSTARLLTDCVENKVAGWSLPGIPDLGPIETTFDIR